MGVTGVFRLEHSKWAYRADAALYATAVGAVTGWLLLRTPASARLDSAVCAGVGLFGWTLAEYLLHRFVLHGVPPFRGWHAEHHRRPMARIYTPTVLSGLLILALVYIPALWLLGALRRAAAVTLGVLTGYLAYGAMHHAAHHWASRSPWMKARKRWHAMHHHAALGGCYGVTSGLWDRLLGTSHVRERQRAADERWGGA